DDGSNQEIDGRDGCAPPELQLRFLQPFCVLIEHRVDDVNERLVAGKETVTPGENITLEPSLKRVFTQHLHHASVASYLTTVGVFRLERGKPSFLARRIDCLQLIWAFSSGLKTRKLFMLRR